MRLIIIHTTDEQLEGKTFEVDNPILNDKMITLNNGKTIRIDKTTRIGSVYQYSNPNYIFLAQVQ